MVSDQRRYPGGPEMSVPVVPLDQRSALRVGALCAATGRSDVVDVSVAICVRDRGRAIITTDPADLRAIDPLIPLLTP